MSFAATSQSGNPRGGTGKRNSGGTQHEKQYIVAVAHMRANILLSVINTWSRDFEYRGVFACSL